MANWRKNIWGRYCREYVLNDLFEIRDKRFFIVHFNSANEFIYKLNIKYNTVLVNHYFTFLIY